MWRVSTQIAGQPASTSALNSHCDSGPASRPIRFQLAPAAASAAMMASGSVGTFVSRMTLPSASTTHTLVSATETSKPAYSSKAALLFASVRPTRGSWFTNPKGPPPR
jgi:hypothetical protein